MALDETAAPITRVIAEKVETLRRAAGLSQAELAERMAALGTGWSRTTVVKLANKRRESVTVQDLLALAIALEVPAVSLLADPRQDAMVPIAEGITVTPWEALLWLVGEGTITGSPRSSVEMDIIAEGRVVAEMAGNLRKRVPRNVPGDTDDLHWRYLETMRIALENIADLGAPVPQLGPHVLKRAADLDVKLPGQDREV